MDFTLTKRPGVFCIEYTDSLEEERHPLAEGLSAVVLGPVDSLPEQSLGQIAEIPIEDRRVVQILKEFPDIEFIDEAHATRTDLVQCKIWMKHQRPIRARARPLAPAKKEYLKKEIDELLKAGVIVPSKSPYASAPVLVKKKDGFWWLAINYRDINKDSEDFPYSLFRIDEIFDQFYGATCYSTLDLARGYWQIEMDPESAQYTAFITSFGQFEFQVMPFGLKQAPGWFQLLMNEVLRPVLGKCAVVYLDDIIIFSPDSQQHEKDLR